MDAAIDKPVSVNHTLFVGEGDFSFSAGYIKKFGSSYEKIYASCFSGRPLTERQQKNVEIIEKNGGVVLTNVDATCLETHPEISKQQFSKIVFNFPHISGKMNIRKNRQLVERFFISSSKVLRDTGRVWVTLCQGQGGTDIEKIKRKWCDTWQVVGLATLASFVLDKVQLFDAEEFELYRSTGFRGLQKPFNTKGAITHIFKKEESVCMTGLMVKDYLDAALYLQNCETLYRNVYKHSNQPHFKILCTLKDITRKVFDLVHQETINDLITCQQTELSDAVDLNVNIGICIKCYKNLQSHIVNKITSHCITSIECNICCIKSIDINKFPFHHFFLLISDDINILLTNLLKFLKHLKSTYIFNNSDLKLASPIKIMKNKENNSFSDKTVDEHFSEKSVLHLYAKYSVNQGDEYFFYSDVDFVISSSNQLEGNMSDNFLNIGSLLQLNESLSNYFGVFLNINALACLKYHIMDYRLLFSTNSYFSSTIINSYSVDLYRSVSLYPPIYIHDTSFYTSEDFCENNLFLVVRNAVGYLVKSISLTDLYYDEEMQKYSRCYRFIYQSCDMALTKENANVIHTQFVRRILEKSLNIVLR